MGEQEPICITEGTQETIEWPHPIPEQRFFSMHIRDGFLQRAGAVGLAGLSFMAGFAWRGMNEADQEAPPIFIFSDASAPRQQLPEVQVGQEVSPQLAAQRFKAIIDSVNTKRPQRVILDSGSEYVIRNKKTNQMFYVTAPILIPTIEGRISSRPGDNYL